MELEGFCSVRSGDEDLMRLQLASDFFGGLQAACIPSYASTSTSYGRRQPVSLVELVIGPAIPL